MLVFGNGFLQVNMLLYDVSMHHLGLIISILFWYGAFQILKNRYNYLSGLVWCV
jgi:hypothetical protein